MPPHAPPAAPAVADRRVGVVGLGFVGLQVAAAFGRVLPTLGYDLDTGRIAELRKGYDRNGEVPEAGLATPLLRFTDAPEDLAACDVFVVAVPTPVDPAKRPDLRALVGASGVVGRALAARAPVAGHPAPVVVYESSVYPGCTEEVCVPALEAASGLRAGRDFHVGYSPERINPGDPEHRFATIVKVVAGQDAATTDLLAALYGRVVPAGVFRARDIRTAEAAKVIENTQRDLNIALMNELAMVFHRLGLDTQEVLRAAGTKWNFLRFSPGLVGGHCIPVDPYYLTHKAEEVGHFPEVILAGRRINDGMGRYIAQEAVKALARQGRALHGARALVLGVAFKEDVPDARNTRVVDLVEELQAYGLEVAAHDPLLGPAGLKRLGLAPAPEPVLGPAPRATYDLVVLAVPHRAYREADPAALAALARGPAGPGVVVDVRSVLPPEAVRATGAALWRL